MSASHSELKDKLTEDKILEIIRSGCRDYLIFEMTSNPPVDTDQWFIRKSSMHGHVTLGIQRHGQPIWMRITDNDLERVLSGDSMWLEADGGKLEVTKLLLPEKAKNFMFFTDKTKPVSAKHPRDKTYTIDKEGIDKVIKMDCTSFLIFACDANPMIDSDQWFLRKSKHQERITLGLQTQGEIKTIELTTTQLDELLSGAIVPEVGCQLELSKMAVPQEALDCLYQLQRPFSRIFKFVDTDDNKHPALQSLVMR